MLNFLGIYWVDKWAFLRLNRSPPLYDETLAKMSAGTIPWAVLVHAMFGLWFYSNPEILVPVAGGGGDDFSNLKVLQVVRTHLLGGDPDARFEVYILDRIFDSVAAVLLYILLMLGSLGLLVAKNTLGRQLMNVYYWLLNRHPEAEGLPDFYHTLSPQYVDGMMARWVRRPGGWAGGCGGCGG
jgi:hypothetical protein